MRSALVTAVLVVMVSVLAIPAGAYTGVVLTFMGDCSDGCVLDAQLGWYDGYTTNGYDEAWDGTVAVPALPGQIELDLVNSTLGAGRWVDDYRSALTPAVEGPEIWLLKAYIPVNDLHQDVRFGLRAWFEPGFELPTSGYLASQSFAVYDGDVRADWFSQTPLWLSPHGVSGSWLSANWSSGDTAFLLPNDGAHYFTVVIAPEPGSMAAVAAGLIGLAGFGIRRRKQAYTDSTVQAQNEAQG